MFILKKDFWFDVKCFANFKAFCKKNISLHSLILMKFNENFPSKSNLKDSKQEFIKSPKIQYKDYIYFWQEEEIFIFDWIKIDPFSPIWQDFLPKQNDSSKFKIKWNVLEDLETYFSETKWRKICVNIVEDLTIQRGKNPRSRHTFYQVNLGGVVKF